MSFHQQMGVESVDEIHKLVGGTRFSQFLPIVLIDHHHEAFRVATRIQIHLVGDIGFSRECHVGDVVSGMCFLKIAKQCSEGKRLGRGLYVKQLFIEGVVDGALVDEQAAGHSQDQQECTCKQARPEMESEHEVAK